MAKVKTDVTSEVKRTKERRHNRRTGAGGLGPAGRRNDVLPSGEKGHKSSNHVAGGSMYAVGSLC